MEWIGIFPLHRQLGLAQGYRATFARHEVFATVFHCLLCLLIQYLPQTYHQDFCSGEHGRSPRRECPLADLRYTRLVHLVGGDDQFKNMWCNRGAIHTYPFLILCAMSNDIFG
jgi:hypothetical protein